MSTTMHDICEGCKGPAKSSKRLYSCHFCSKFFHSGCGIRSSRLADGTQIKACPCNPPNSQPLNQKSENLINLDAASSSQAQNDSGASSSAKSSKKTNDADSSDIDVSLANAILARLDSFDQKLNTIKHDMHRELQATRTAQEEMNKKVKDLPALVRTVKEHDTAIAELRRENKEIRQQINAVCERVQATTDSHCEERFSSLEQSTTALSNQLVQLKTSFPRNTSLSAPITALPKSPPSSQVVLSGLEVPAEVNYRKLAFAVLKPLYPELELVDIPSARPMIPKIPKSSDKPMSGSTTTAASTSSSSASRSVSELDPSASTEDHSPAPRPPSIIVNLTSSSLVRTLISGKIRHGKLHTQQLGSEELADANITTCLRPALINVNEYLPKDVFQLLRWVRSQTKVKGFSCFTRNGVIYARWSKSSPAVIVNRPEDLENFLMASAQEKDRSREEDEEDPDADNN